MGVRTRIPADQGLRIAGALVSAIEANAAELSRIDGAIGDGDHGVNMSKGFGLAGARLGSRQVSISEALDTIGDTLLREVGGSMGPLYGAFFQAMGASCAGVDDLDALGVARMLDAGLSAVVEIGGAGVGDKTLVDVLVPARAAFEAATASGADLGSALTAMVRAADEGREATRDMVARVGRASRLGERSRGVPDPGATSCAILLGAFAAEAAQTLNDGA